MTRGERDDQPNRRFLARYGAIILRGGIASIPTALYRYQGELGLKPNQVWFIAFAPRHDPKVAIAVTVECSSGTGGDTAAPIAKRVMQELLR